MSLYSLGRWVRRQATEPGAVTVDVGSFDVPANALNYYLDSLRRDLYQGEQH